MRIWKTAGRWCACLLWKACTHVNETNPSWIGRWECLRTVGPGSGAFDSPSLPRKDSHWKLEQAGTHKVSRNHSSPRKMHTVDQTLSCHMLVPPLRAVASSTRSRHHPIRLPRHPSRNPRSWTTSAQLGVVLPTTDPCGPGLGRLDVGLKTVENGANHVVWM